MKNRTRSAFTLVELLVVIAIIALLVAMLLPGLGKARGIAKLLKETSNSKQLVQMWSNYATDNKDVYIPGYKHYNWAHTHNSYGGLWLLNNEGYLMAGTPMKPWPNMLWPYFNWDMQGLLTDVAGARVFDDFSKRQRFVNPGNQPDVTVPSGHYETAHNWSTSFGYNTDFVGGNFLRGAFYEFWGSPGSPYATSSSLNSPIKRRWYVQRASEYKNPPAWQMVFTSSRGTDYAGRIPGVIPGYYDITPPSGPRSFSAAVGADWSTLAARRPFDTRATPTGPAPVPADWGYVDCRYINQQAVSAFGDGHAEALGIDDLYDMRKWSTWADGPNWRWTPQVRSTFVQ